MLKNAPQGAFFFAAENSLRCIIRGRYAAQ
jgi:hypothetical protein